MGLAFIFVVLARARARGFAVITPAALVSLSLVASALQPFTIPLALRALLVLTCIGLAVLGGDPFARWILTRSAREPLREGSHGGILLATAGTPREVMRGGSTIGFLERGVVAMAIAIGYPEVIALVIAVKGIARFSELEAAEARERFITGTLASLGWAGVVAAIARLCF